MVLEAVALIPTPLLAVLVLLAAAAVCELRLRLARWGVPGPRSARHLPLVGVTHAFVQADKDDNWTHWVADNSKWNDYRTWMCTIMGQHMIFTHSPAHVSHVLQARFDNYILGHQRQEAFEPIGGRGIAFSEGERWRQQRRMASHLFTARQLRERMCAVFQRHAQQLVAVLRSVAEGETVDLHRLLNCFTFDCINEIALGRGVDSLGGDRGDLDFQEAFDDVSAICTRRFFDPSWKVQRLLGVGREARLVQKMAVIGAYLRAVVDARLAREGDPQEGDGKDVLTLFIEHSEQEGVKWRIDDFRDLVMNFVLAGRDTTAAAAAWGFWALSRPENAAARERLEQEFDSIDGFDVAAPYCQAVFQEVIRLYPPIPLLGKFATAADVLPCGTHVPKGSAVFFNPYAFNRNPDNFPDRTLEFVPERWIDPATGECLSYDKTGFKFPVFNAGPRICLGRSMAALEFRIILQAVMTECRLDPPPGFAPQSRFTAVLAMRDGPAGALPVTVRTRTPAASNG